MSGPQEDEDSMQEHRPTDHGSSPNHRRASNASTAECHKLCRITRDASLVSLYLLALESELYKTTWRAREIIMRELGIYPLILPSSGNYLAEYVTCAYYFYPSLCS